MLFAYLIVLQSDAIGVLLERKLFSPYLLSILAKMVVTTILSDHDVNASYVLLESITFYWMLFSVFEGREWYIKQYFDQTLVVATHFNILIFPIFKWLINERNSEGITNTAVLF